MSQINYSQCNQSVTVGSAVGVPNLQQALNSNILTTNVLGYVTTSYCVSGTFDLNVPITFYNVDVNILPNSKLTVSSTNNQYLDILFDFCRIYGNKTSSKIEVSRAAGSNNYYNSILFFNSSVNNLDLISATNLRAYVSGSLTNYSQINKIEAKAQANFYSYDDNFNKAHIEILSGANIFTWESYFTTGSSNTGSTTGNIPENFGILIGPDSHGKIFICNFHDNYAGIRADKSSTLIAKNNTFTLNRRSIYATDVIPNLEAHTNNMSSTNNSGNGYYFSKVPNFKTYGNTINMTSAAGVPFNLGMCANYNIHNNPILQGFFSNLQNSSGKISDNPNMCAIWINENANKSSIENNAISSEGFYATKLYNSREVIVRNNNYSNPAQPRSLWVESGSLNSIECNYFYGQTGLVMTRPSLGSVGSHEGLNIFDNQFLSNNIGIQIFNGTANFPVQVDKGNDFYNNVTWGIEANDISVPKFFTRSTWSSENPTRTPQTIISSTGALIIPQCFSGIPPGSDGPYTGCTSLDLAYIQTLINQYNECMAKMPEKGDCHDLALKIKKMVDSCPSYLNSTIVPSFISSFNNSDISKLPTFETVQDNILVATPQQPVSPTINNANQPTSADLEGISNYFQQLNVLAQDYRSEEISKIASQRNLINNAIVTNPSVLKYKNVILWYLDAMDRIALSPTRQQAIIDLAEDCDELNGQAGRVARYLCGYYELTYDNISCVNIRSKNKQTENSKLLVTPNPTSNFITLKNVDQGIKVDLIDVTGSLVISTILGQDGLIDISSLKSGIYFVKTPDNQTSKFIKID